MTIRKYGNEPAETEVKAEDNDAETLEAMRLEAALAASPVVAAQIDDFLANPETGEIRSRRIR